MREAILKSGKTKQTEEEMRVLYVALTRARERLYVTAATKRTEEALCTTAQKRAMFRTRHTILSCTSYLDWILMALCNDKEQLSYSLNFIVPQSIEKESIIATAEEVEELPIEETIVNQELFDMPDPSSHDRHHRDHDGQRQRGHRRGSHGCLLSGALPLRSG